MRMREAEICEAVIGAFLEPWAKGKATNFRFPEQDQNGPPVEVTFDIAGESYAIEITSPPSINSQRHDDAIFDEFRRPLDSNPCIQELTRGGTYILSVPVGGLAATDKRDRKGLQAVLVSWIKSELPALVGEQPHNSVTGTISYRGSNLNVLFVRFRDDRPQGLICMRSAPSEQELKEQRNKEITRLAEKKWNEKLVRCGQLGARTCLIFEIDDIALGEESERFASSVQAELKLRHVVPDYVFLIYSHAWRIWPIRIVGQDLCCCEIRNRIVALEGPPRIRSQLEAVVAER